MRNTRAALSPTGMRFCLAGLLPASPALVSAEIYKWVSADGIVHYTNIKPKQGVNYATFSFPCYASDPSCRGVDWEKVPLNTRAFTAEILDAAERHAVEPSLIRAVIHAESAYAPEAVSPKGAQGLMQLMPGTARELAVLDPFDPNSNIDGGTLYLARLLDEFDGDWKLATAAYNAGPGAVRKYSGVPPYDETREYVRRVEILYRRYRVESG